MTSEQQPRKIKVSWPSQQSAKSSKRIQFSLPNPRNLFKSKAFVVVIVVLIAALPAFYFYNKSRVAEQRLNDPNTANQQVINAVVKKVSHLMLLPTDEQPTLATISDASKTKGQPFFTNAKNGDKLLVFTNARKAILYRPSTNLIIEVAPLNVSPSSSGTQ
ncbi:MAG: hypothetical protein AAB436_04950 [Patescibacteria group bacterium]